MQKPLVHIPEPCNEDWNNMQPNPAGRHCALCEKTVTDFTSYSNEEIVAYLRRHTGNKICGRVKAEQIQAEVLRTTNRPNTLLRRIAAAILLYMGFTNTACKTPEKTGNITDRMSINGSEGILTGDIAIADTPQILTQAIDSQSYILGGIPIPPAKDTVGKKTTK